MPGITIRLTDGTHQLIRQEADQEGVGMTAYIREAALMRAWYSYATREGIDHQAVNEVRAWLRTQDRRHREDG